MKKKDYNTLAKEGRNVFFEWLIKHKSKGNKLSIYQKGDILSRWYSSELEDMIGVLTLYFESVGIKITPAIKYEYYTVQIIDTYKLFSDIEQAWTKAIERANELRNEQLNNNE